MKKNKGVTMIALVITVIILLILSAVAINALAGDNGILNKSKSAAEETQKANAKEKLLLALEEASIEKSQNTQYNKDDYLNNVIEAKIDNSTISGDIVSIDGYNFTIDRDKLAITDISNVKVANNTSSTNSNIANASVLVDNANQLKQFADLINSGDSFSGKIVVLTSDIDLSSICSASLGNWNSIGNSTTNFSGVFDGNGHTISNLYIDTTNNTVGLFGIISSAGVVENLKLSNSNVGGNSQVGIICGYNSGLIERCSNDNGNVSGKNPGVGGIAGGNSGEIRESYNNSNISSTYYEIGGIAGYNYGIIEECYNSGNITNSSVTIGGITGGNYDTILNCYNKGKIQSTGTDTFGGIAGYSNTNAYSAANLPKAIIRNSYNIGTMVTTGTGAKGGIVGNAGNVAAINNYWLSTCGASYGNSGSSPNNTGSTSKSDTEIKALALSLGASYTQDAKGINNGYPILKWQTEN